MSLLIRMEMENPASQTLPMQLRSSPQLSKTWIRMGGHWLIRTISRMLCCFLLQQLPQICIIIMTGDIGDGIIRVGILAGDGIIRVTIHRTLAASGQAPYSYK